MQVSGAVLGAWEGLMTQTYEEVKARESARLGRMRSEGRDVALDYPEPGNLELREACRFNLQLFYESYFPEVFTRPWCPDLLRVIEVLQDCAIHGGFFCLAMLRGGGKTVLSLRAAMWATLYG